MAEPFRVLSLGAGVDSTTLLLMSEHGDVPHLDAAEYCAGAALVRGAVGDNAMTRQQEALAAASRVHRQLRRTTLHVRVRTWRTPLPWLIVLDMGLWYWNVWYVLRHA